MKKKIIVFLFLFIASICFSNLYFNNTAKAEETVTISQIGIARYPTKTTYGIGESFDATGLEVISMNSDGTSMVIIDYTVEGYNTNQVGNQTITIRYQGFAASFNIMVYPAKTTNISVSEHSMTSYTLTWDAGIDVSYYEIYRLDAASGIYSVVATTQSNSYSTSDFSGAIYSYQIRSVKTIEGIMYFGEFSDPYMASTDPEQVGSLIVVGTTDNSVDLSWSAVNGATGYSIYRLAASSQEYILVGDTTSTMYTDTGLKAGTSYQYKVCAYKFNISFSGEFSPIADTSTYPAKVIFKCKAGDQKVRLTWKPVTGASSYEIYSGDESSGFSLIASIAGNDTGTYTVESLVTGATYSFYMVARREYNGVSYEGTKSDIMPITILEIEDTSLVAKFFIDETGFMNSNAYKRIPFFQANVNYSESYVIPGLITTNISGFNSTTMCPQGIAFVEDYLLITAYDLSKEENSVIYVLDKATKELLTTLVLPTNTHLGGICYDGKNVWVTTGTKISAMWFSDILAAATEGKEYYDISFHSVCKVGISASYITYYHDKLWVGSYNELKTTKMYSFTIDDYGTYITLTKVDTITMPTRVQGIVFTEEGKLIMSRSCQLYLGLRGYMRRIDVYQPEFSEEDSGRMDLGKCINYVYVPSMNEGIALDGDTLYVLFESAAFSAASYTVDRVCAFPLTSILGIQE